MHQGMNRCSFPHCMQEQQTETRGSDSPVASVILLADIRPLNKILCECLYRFEISSNLPWVWLTFATSCI